MPSSLPCDCPSGRNFINANGAIFTASVMQLRDYQQRAIDGLFQYFEHNSGNPLLVLPTGSGKSVIIGALCKLIIGNWPDQRLMIVSHVKELLSQNFGKIQ